ncbi:cysteine proteinase [Hymenopellis radicata]|nr:cysteine proteinase [Hymenopellis radicata]
MSTSWPLNGELRDSLRIKTIHSRYTPSQISQWLSSISFPTSYSADELARGAFPTTLENMHIINRLHIVTYPYENTAMHYTKNRDMDISPAGLFSRIVGEGKGSYCFGMNIFFLEALRGLGYRAYSGAGRINESETPTGEPPLYTPFVHMVLFVQPGTTSRQRGHGRVATESHRLSRGSRPDCSLEASPTVDWRLEVMYAGKENKEPIWRIVYTFTEVEFFEKDYQAANFVVSKMAGTFFSDKIVFSKHFWLSKKEAEELGADPNMEDSPATRYIGRIGVKGAVFNRHVGAGTELLVTAKTERERRNALRKYGGFDISLDDLEYIRRSLAALPFE